MSNGGETVNQEFIKWIQSYPKNKRKDTLQRVVSGGVLNGTSAKDALRKLKTKAFVHIQKLNFARGLIDQAKSLSNRGSTSGAAAFLELTNAGQGSLVTDKPCPRSRKRLSVCQEDGSDPKKQKLDTGPPSVEVYDQPPSLEIQECIQQPSVEIINLDSPAPGETSSESSSNSSSAPVDKSQSSSSSSSNVAAVDANVGPILASTTLAANDSQQVNSLHVTPAESCAEPVSNTNLPSQKVKPNNHLSSQERSSQQSAVVSQRIPEPSIQPTVMPAMMVENNLTSAVASQQTPSSNQTVRATADATQPPVAPSARAIESMLADVAKAIYDAENEMKKLNETLQALEREHPGQKPVSAMKALMESCDVLQMKSTSVKFCVERGVVRLLDRHFYPKLLRLVQKQPKLKLYTCLRLVTVVNMLLSISQPQHDPKQVLASYVAKSLTDQAKQNQSVLAAKNKAATAQKPPYSTSVAPGQQQLPQQSTSVTSGHQQLALQSFSSVTSISPGHSQTLQSSTIVMPGHQQSYQQSFNSVTPAKKLPQQTSGSVTPGRQQLPQTSVTSNRAVVQVQQRNVIPPPPYPTANVQNVIVSSRSLDQTRAHSQSAQSKASTISSTSSLSALSKQTLSLQPSPQQQSQTPTQFARLINQRFSQASSTNQINQQYYTAAQLKNNGLHASTVGSSIGYTQLPSGIQSSPGTQTLTSATPVLGVKANNPNQTTQQLIATNGTSNTQIVQSQIAFSQQHPQTQQMYVVRQQPLPLLLNQQPVQQQQQPVQLQYSSYQQSVYQGQSTQVLQLSQQTRNVSQQQASQQPTMLQQVLQSNVQFSVRPPQETQQVQQYPIVYAPSQNQVVNASSLQPFHGYSNSGVQSAAVRQSMPTVQHLQTDVYSGMQYSQPSDAANVKIVNQESPAVRTLSRDSGISTPEPVQGYDDTSYRLWPRRS